MPDEVSPEATATAGAQSGTEDASHHPSLHDAVASPEHRDKVLSHFRGRFGVASMVFHELRSKVVHVDVHVFPATAERPFLTLATCGMSALEMSAENFDETWETPYERQKRLASEDVTESPGETQDHLSRAELILYLPEDWDFSGPDGLLPIEYLIQTAKFPHANRTYVAEGHTISNNPESLPYFEGSLLTCTYLMYPFVEEVQEPKDSFYHVDLTDDCHLHVYWIQPITIAERYLFGHEGMRALNTALVDHKVFTLDLDRSCSVVRENREERRSRERAQKRRRSRPGKLPWQDLPCGRCELTLGEMAHREAPNAGG